MGIVISNRVHANSLFGGIGGFFTGFRARLELVGQPAHLQRADLWPPALFGLFQLFQLLDAVLVLGIELQ